MLKSNKVIHMISKSYLNYITDAVSRFSEQDVKKSKTLGALVPKFFMEESANTYYSFD